MSTYGFTAIPLPTGWPRTRTLACSGSYWEEGNVGYQPFGIASNYMVTVFGNSASLTCGTFTSGFEEDTSAAVGTWGSPGSTRRWRAWITTSSTRQVTSTAAGTGAALTDTQTVYSTWSDWTYPYTPAAINSPAVTLVTQAASASWTASLDMQESWTNSGPVELCTAASISVTFNCTQYGKFEFYRDGNVPDYIELNYSYTTPFSASGTPNSLFTNYTAVVAGTVHGNNTISWSGGGTGPGITWSSTESQTAPNRTSGGVSSTGVGTFTGTSLSGSLQNDNTGGGYYSTVSATWQPVWASGATLQVNRYRDGAGYPGVTALWTPDSGATGVTVVTDATGAAPTGTLVYPYDGSFLEFKTLTISGSVVLNLNPSRLLHSFLYDPTWADGAGVFLKANSLGRAAGGPQRKGYRAYPIGTITVAESHSYDLFSSLSWWTDPSVGTGTSSLDLGGIKLVPSTAPYGIVTRDATSTGQPIKKLRCFAYRYYKVTVRSDTAGAQVRIGLSTRLGAAAPLIYYWTFTITAANTWEDHELDLALPQSASDGSTSETIILHPTTFFSLKGSMQVTALTAGSTLWIKAFTGFLKRGGGRTPTLWLHDLNCAGGTPRQWNVTPSSHLYSNGTDFIEPDFSSGGGDYNRIGIPQGHVWGRLVTNGVVAMDVVVGANGTETQSLETAPTSPRTSACAEFWHQLKLICDDDTGVTVTEDATSVGLLYDDLVTSWGRSGLWTTLNDTATPDTLAVGVEPMAAVLAPFYPGCGDYYNGGSYNARQLTHWHDWRGGEIMGLLARRSGPLAGKALALSRHPSGTAVGSATSDPDGFWRIFAPYGATLPYSNNPAGTHNSTHPDWVKQYTANIFGQITGYPNTTLGNTFSPFALQSAAFKIKDGSQFALRPDSSTYAGTTRELLGCWDRWGTYWSYGDELGGQKPWLLRDDNGDRLHFYLDGANNLVRDRFPYDGDAAESLKNTVTLDSSGTAGNPSFRWKDGLLEGFFTTSTNVKRAWSQDHGESWTVETLGFTYTAHDWDAYRGSDAVYVGWDGTNWKAHYGLWSASTGAYTWSAGVTISGLTSPSGDGKLRCREDGSVELLWMDTSGVGHIVRTPYLDTTGAGSWS